MASHITHTALAGLTVVAALFGAAAAFACAAPQGGSVSADMITLASVRTSPAATDTALAYAPTADGPPANYETASRAAPSTRFEPIQAAPAEASSISGLRDGANLSFSGQGRRFGADASQP